MARGKIRRDRENRGKVELSKSQLEKLIKKHDRFDYYRNEFIYSSTEDSVVNIPIRRFTIEELEDLVEILSSSLPRPQGMINQIRAHLEILKNPKGKPIGSLTLLETAIHAYLKDHILEGWIFLKNRHGYMEPYLVDSITYYPTEVVGKGHVIPAHVTLSAKRWDEGKINSVNFTWHQSDLGKSVNVSLLDENIHTETKELIKEYYDQEKIFLNWRAQMGMQFLGNGNGVFSVLDEDRFYSSYDSDLSNTRLVVDDSCQTIERHQGTGLFQDIEDMDSPAVDPEAAEKYTRLPVNLMINCFNLDSHRNGLIHISHMKPYVYRPEIKKNLILPEEHDDLITALTSDMDVLMEDIVSGKSGGTAIICQGKSGTGKTLTAEIFAEVVKRPLYRVHSGQLGIDAETVESELKKAMERAKRWGALMLIDEADVFVMKRGASLELNAVCGVFLRVLEYYDGLLFLTTNRSDEIDDAILSRCIAHINYQAPDEDERARLWRSLGEVYQLDLVKQKGMDRKLAQAFSTATGRDIKGLIRLSIKYARQRKKPVTFNDLKRFAPYKGL